jgi:hypothetical protein
MGCLKSGVDCRWCGKTMWPGDRVCAHCGREQPAAAATPSQPATPVTSVSLEGRRRALLHYMASYSTAGFRVMSQTDVNAQLMRTKEFNFIAAVLWFLLFGIGLLIYVFFYL